MVEAAILFKLLPTTILDIDKVFEPLVCCFKGIWVHLFTYHSTGHVGPRFGNDGLLMDCF